MKRTWILLSLIAACGSDENARPADESGIRQMPNAQVRYREDLIWHGSYWTGDYFAVEDRMLWADLEGTFLAGREVSPADAEGRATFAVHGRRNNPANWVRSKNFFASRPAHHQDLRRGRWVYISDTVLTSPKHMIEEPQPPKAFVEHSKKEPWHRFYINNTSELQFGRVDLLIDNMTHIVPIWAIRVENKETQ
jgi:hypothetical protein